MALDFANSQPFLLAFVVLNTVSSSLSYFSQAIEPSRTTPGPGQTTWMTAAHEVTELRTFFFLALGRSGSLLTVLACYFKCTSLILKLVEPLGLAFLRHWPCRD